MLLGVLFACVLFCEVYNSEGNTLDPKPCSFPVPLELPNRNDRSDQCWLRIEDAELTETITVFCYIAHGFLRSYIHDYNSRQMTQDKVDVTLWPEDARPYEDHTKSSITPNGLTDWKLTTVLDPVTRMRLYVSKKAGCKLIMYTREGTSNYNIDCERILFYINGKMQANAARSHQFNFLLVCIFLIISIIVM